ncbi:MAG: CBS domain-containing protein [Deltaproteobacteria bacterium]|nr:MAG: CBS domain-containing protein [Deltaproteobacteria bacterium]
MQIQKFMTKNPEFISPQDSLSTAAEKMQKLDVGFLPVVDNGKLAGVITDRDLVIRGLANKWNPEQHQVKECMSETCYTCFEDDEVEQAVKAMEDKQIRRIPIVNRENKLVGVISVGDVACETHDQKLSGEIIEKISEKR